MDALRGKINRITNWQAAVIIAVIGFAVFSIGLSNQFIGDDLPQIRDNPVVHSMGHIGTLFQGSTFYNGNGFAPLAGSYYRPLMSTVFAIIYSLFGAHTLPFHLIQLIICIGSSILLFLVFRYTFSPHLSLVLSLIFLVHPINSQVVFAIASLQDALFFFFGILAIWLLLRYQSVRSLLLAASSLFLSLLSKESGLLFVIIALLYLFWFDRKRFHPCIGILALPLTIYFWLKISAVGLNAQSSVAPIDKLGLSGRMLTAPSVLLLFLSKFVFPWQLSASYYWTHPTFSVRHVLLPILIDIAFVAGIIYAGFAVRKRANKALYITYLFYATWTIIGLVPYLQIVPMDMTVCETWFYFLTAGLLGIIGVILITFKPRLQMKWIAIICIVIVACLSLRTAIRGRDWSNAYTLASKNISANQANYISYDEAANQLIKQGNYATAKPYVEKSIKLHPSYANYNSLGLILANQGDYSGALDAFNTGLTYGNSISIYENMSQTVLASAPSGEDIQQLTSNVNAFPNDYELWEFLAVAQARAGDTSAAKISILKAASLGNVPQIMIERISNGQPFKYNLGAVGKQIAVN